MYFLSIFVLAMIFFGCAKPEHQCADGESKNESGECAPETADSKPPSGIARNIQQAIQTARAIKPAQPTATTTSENTIIVSGPIDDAWTNTTPDSVEVTIPETISIPPISSPNLGSIIISIGDNDFAYEKEEELDPDESESESDTKQGSNKYKLLDRPGQAQTPTSNLGKGKRIIVRGGSPELSEVIRSAIRIEMVNKSEDYDS